MRSRRMIPVTVAALVLAACWPVFRPPEVRLDGVRLGSIGLTGGTLTGYVVVDNPNAFALRTVAIGYNLELNDPANNRWVPLAEGTLDREVSVPANDSAVVELPLSFTYSGIGAAIRSILESGTFEYRIAGDLRLTEPLRRQVPFRRTGTVSIIERGSR